VVTSAKFLSLSTRESVKYGEWMNINEERNMREERNDMSQYRSEWALWYEYINEGEV